jgi:hypothetical protein
MVPLHSKKFPESAADLATSLDAALRRYVGKSGPIVTARSRVFPYFDSIDINFDGAELDSPPAISFAITDETKPACEAAMVNVSARNLSVRGAPVNARMEARDVVFHQGKDANGEAVLIVHEVRDGSAVISAAQTDLENALAQIVQTEARKRGITIEQVRLALRARGARSVGVEVRVSARKFIMRANIDISGQIDVDDDFVAKISNLKCKGEGALGSLACGALDPHFRRLDGQTFPLLSLPLGEVQLRDIRIAVADTVEITADFGSASV